MEFCREFRLCVFDIFDLHSGDERVPVVRFRRRVSLVSSEAVLDCKDDFWECKRPVQVERNVNGSVESNRASFGDLKKRVKISWNYKNLKKN
jgi:hypothetical protein